MLACKDICYSLVTVMLFAVAADIKRHHSDWLWFLAEDQAHTLGVEYDSIAQSIASGRGFSDPFHSNSGPTAWMPPIQPLFLAGIYSFWKTRERVSQFIVGFQCFVAFLTGLLVLQEMRRLGRPFIGYIVFPCCLLISFHHVFQSTHDFGILGLFVCVLWWTFSRSPSPGKSSMATWGSGIIGGLAVLGTPVLGLVWLALLLAKMWQFRRVRYLPERGPVLHFFAPLAIAAALTTPWTIRNLLVLDTLVPVKSNAGYELWLAQCIDDDGVLDSQTFRKHVRKRNSEAGKRYREVGEIVFVREMRARAFEAIGSDPRSYLGRVMNRALAMFLIYRPARKTDSSSLIQVIFPLPFIGFLIVMVAGYNRRNQGFLTASLICLVGHLPYLLISYYPRYSSPFMLTSMLWLGYGIHDISSIGCSLVYNIRRSRQEGECVNRSLEAPLTSDK